MRVPAELDRRVRERAKGVCEYCRLPQADYPLPFDIDHIIAEQHRGKTQLNNLCQACPRCNRNKGPNISGIDDPTRKLTPLFNPRRDRWADHFAWRGPRLRGRTPVGRVTVQLLGMNDPQVVKLRRELIAEGKFPPR
jgi:5-methylcytosine-specific restriction endonuclease McrA